MAEQLVHIVKGRQPERRVLDRMCVPESARSIHHFETTYLTPTDGLQDAVGLESWGSLDSKALIKLEKTREEPKSSAAGERKELMLKSKTLESICWPVWFLGHAYLWE